MLCLLVLAEECAHGDGQIALRTLESTKGVSLTVAGKNAGFRNEGEAALKGGIDIDELDPRTVHAYVTGGFIRHFGLIVNYELRAGEMEFHLTF